MRKTKIKMSDTIRTLMVRKNASKDFTQHYLSDRKLSVFGQSRAVAISLFKSASGKNSAGFTLIEVLIAMAIMGIMAGIIAVSLGNGRIERELEANAREFTGVVREAQNYALTGKQAIVGTDPCRFRISWSGSSYTLTYWFKDTGEVCNQNSVMATYTLKNGVVFSNADAFYFTLPHATLDFAAVSKEVILNKQSINHVVCVYATGRISDQLGIICP